MECLVNTFTIYSCSSEAGDRILDTKVSIDLDDFQVYTITEPATLVFNLKDFRKVLNFADSMATNLTAKFDGPGSALIWECQPSNTLEVEFVLATVPDPEWLPSSTIHQDLPDIVHDDEHEEMYQSPIRKKSKGISIFQEMKD